MVDTYVWQIKDGDWADEDNWINDTTGKKGVPGAGDVAAFTNGKFQVDGPGTAGLIEVYSDITFTGDIEAKGLGISQSAFVIDIGKATFTSGSSLTTGKDVVVGFQLAGQFVMEAGATADLTVPAGQGGLYIGGLASAAGSTGLITGAGTTLTSNSGLTVGTFGAGYLKIADQALVDLGDTSSFGVYVGYQAAGQLDLESGATLKGAAHAVLGGFAGATGTAKVSGSGTLWEQTSTIAVGFGGSGDLTVKDSAKVKTAGINSGVQATSTGNKITIEGAGEIEAGFVNLGVASGSDSTFKMTSEAGKLTVADGLDIGVGGYGELILDQGGTAKAKSLDIAVFATSGASNKQSLVSVKGSGSKLEVEEDFVVGVGGFGKLEVSDGGKIDHKGGEVTFGQLLNGHGDLDVKGAATSLTFDTVKFGDGGSARGTVEGEASITVQNLHIAGQSAHEGSVLFVDNASLTVVKDLVVGVAGDGDLRVGEGGTLDHQGSKFVLGQDAGSHGQFLLSRPESAANFAGEIMIGKAGHGLFELDRGATIVTESAVRLAVEEGSTGQVHLSRTTGATLWISKGPMTIGEAGLGDFVIDHGASVALNGKLVIGDKSTAYGELEILGPGESSGNEVNASMLVTQEAVIGKEGSGYVFVERRSTFDFKSDVILAEMAGSIANLEANFSSKINAQGQTLVVGKGGHATVKIQSGSLLDVTGGVVLLGAEEGSKGNIHVDSGELDGGTITYSKLIADHMSIGPGGGEVKGTNGAIIDIANDFDNEGDIKLESGASLFVGGSLHHKGEGTIHISAKDALTKFIIAHRFEQGARGITRIIDAGAVFEVKGDAEIAGIVEIDDANEFRVGGNMVLSHEAAEETTFTAWDPGTLVTVAGDVVVAEAGKADVLVKEGADFTVGGALVIGELAGSLGTFTIQDEATLAVAGDLTVGADGTGILVNQKGKLSVGGTSIVVGESATGIGTLTFGGDGTELDFAGTIEVGASGNGIMFVEQGAKIDADVIELGAKTGSIGELHVKDGDSVLEVGELTIGALGAGRAFVTDGGKLVSILDAAVAEIVNGTPSEVTVASGGQWLATGSITLGGGGQGVLDVTSAGQVATLGDLVLGEIVGSTGTVTVDDGGVGPAHDTSLGWGGSLVVGEDGDGFLSVLGGALVAPTLLGEGHLEIAATDLAKGTVTVEGTSSALIAHVVSVGGTETSSGGQASLAASNGGAIEIDAELIVWGKGTVSASSGGGILVGEDGAIHADKLTVGDDGEVLGNGTILADIVNDGHIKATTLGQSLADMLLSLEGDVTGSGRIDIAHKASLELGGALAAGLTVTFLGGGSTLYIESAGAAGVEGAIAGFASSDKVVVAGTTAVGSAFDKSTNVLDLLDGSSAVVASLQLTDFNDFSAFLLSSDGKGGTIVEIGGNAPVITSSGGGDEASPHAPENGTAVVTVTATDADNDALTFSIVGGADAAKFAIGATSGVLTFLAAPDYENPSDADGDNSFEVEVRVADGRAGIDVQVLHVVVDDVAGKTINGTAAANTLIGTPENDTLNGLGGNDRLDGGGKDAASDTLAGGAGNDTYVIWESGTDTIVETAGKAGGIDTVEAYALYNLQDGDNLENLTLKGGKAGELRSAFGNDLANTIAGDISDDLIGGGFGDGQADTLKGGKGNDTCIVEAGDKVVEAANAGIDTVRAYVDGYKLAGNVENLELNDGAINGTGNSLDNIIVGTDGANKLDGSSGNDVLVGGEGGDTLIGGAGLDYASYDGPWGPVVANLADPSQNTGYAKGDTYSGIEGLIGSTDDDTLTGDDNANVLVGGVGGDLLIGGAGNDTLEGGEFLSLGSIAGDAFVDILRGGAGDDVYMIRDTLAVDVIEELVGQGSDTVRSFIAHFSLQGVANVENVEIAGAVAGELRSATGNELANVLTGGASDDTLDGGTDAAATIFDKLQGGKGDDTYIVRDGKDIVVEQFGEGTDTIEGYVSVALAANVENLRIAEPAGAASGTGNALTNLIQGNSEANVLDGAGGNDVLEGGLGDDTLVGGAGTDTASYEHGNGVIVTLATTDQQDTFAAGLDTLVGIENLTGSALSGDILTGSKGANVLRGLGGDDLLTGDDGDDTLDGGAGKDLMIGGAGNDTYIVDNLEDVVQDLAVKGGTDTIRASLTWSLDTFNGSVIENLVLTSSADIDATGNALVNTITGNAGDNLLDGKAGADKLIGGAGDDIYVIDDKGDKVTEAAGAAGGVDTARIAAGYGGAGYTLAANVENLELLEGANVAATGNALANRITGNASANTLNGGSGDDTLVGGLGADLLTGGAGKDMFLFLSPGEGGDTIKDFVSTSGDRIGILGSSFGGLAAGSLDPLLFEVVASGGAAGATGAQTRFYYVTGADSLFYDADGAGSADATLITTFSTSTLVLAASDIKVI